MAYISLNNVGFSYEGKKVLSGIHFSVEKGDYLCIVGENGAGKSTLLKGLLGLKKVSEGEIVFGDGLKANEIGYLPQQTENQKDFPASCYEVVESGRLNKLSFFPFYRKEDKKAALDAMAYLKIEDLKNACFRELSGGQRQRVLLARALAASQKLLVVDEPVAGLDPLAQKELYAMLESLNREKGMTIIMVSHDIREVVERARIILHLDGKQLFFGSTEAYLASSWGKLLVKEEEHA